MLLVHCADIHIRNTTRYNEYDLQLKKFIKDISAIKPKYVVVAGDLFHSQTILSPESFFLARNFIRNILKVCKIIIIPGNHDLNLNQLKRMDGVTSFIDEFSEDEIFYLKKSGNYDFDDEVTFSSFSIIDKDYPKLPNNNKKKVALYHGTISGSENNFGFKFTSNDTISIFNGWDIALLGDIHKMQYLDNKKRIAYSGSLIQQNMGESLDKGYIVWDLNTFESEFIKLQNDYSFIKISSDDLSKVNLTKYCHIEYVDSKKRSHQEEAEIKKDIYKLATKQESEILSYKYECLEDDQIVVIDEEVENIHDLNVQKQLLEEFLSLKNHNKEIIEGCKNLHEKVFHDVIKNENTVKNWSIESLKFSNLFAYGEDNEFDFHKLNGVTGIFGHNTAGKSSILSAIKYAIWGESTNKTPVDKILNFQSDFASSNIVLRSNGIKYEIEREIKKSKIGKISTDVFIKTNNEKISGKTDVKNIIIELFGTPQDFSDTAFCTQFEMHKLVYTKPAERKQLLIDFLGLDIFNKFLDSIKKKHNELEYQLKSFSKNKIIEEHSNITKTINEKESKYLSISSEINGINLYIENINLQIENLLKQIKEIKNIREEALINSDLNIAKNKCQDIDNKLNKLESKSENDLLEEIKTTLRYHELNTSFEEKSLEEIKNEVKNTNEYSNIADEISKFIKIDDYEIDINKELLRLEDLKNLQFDTSNLKIEIVNLNNELLNINEKIKESKKRVKIIDEKDWYRTNDYCKQCSFLSDAFDQEKNIDDYTNSKAKIESAVLNKISELEKINEKNKKINDDILELSQKIENIRQYQVQKNTHENLLQKIEILEQKAINEYNIEKANWELNKVKLNDLIKNYKSEHLNSIQILKYELEKAKNEFVKFEIELEEYKKNIDTIKSNNEIQLKINDNKSILSSTKEKLVLKNNEYNEIKADLIVCKNNLEKINKQLKDIKIVEKDFEIYDAYYSAMQRDGLPKSMMIKYINIITNKMNDFLKDIVDWRMKLRSDNDNIEIIIEENNGFESNADETGSGMQVTLIGLTLRVILNIISKKAKSKFLFIDEPFLSLDYEIKSKIEHYFDHLRRLFSHIVIISHLEIQDICDNIIIAEKINGKSKLIVN